MEVMVQKTDVTRDGGKGWREIDMEQERKLKGDAIYANSNPPP
jgi:hypothetical protein